MFINATVINATVKQCAKPHEELCQRMTKTTPQNPTEQTQPSFTTSFLQPKYWAIWLGFAVFLPLVYLPITWQSYLGRNLGKLIFYLGKRRRQDTLINLGLCFPNLDEPTRYHTAKQVYMNAGTGLFESLTAWFRPQAFHKRVTISGLHHLVAAQNDGKGVLLLGIHSTLLDLGGLLCSWFFEPNVVYRPQNNPLLEWFIYSRRRKIYKKQLSARKIGRVFDCLAQGDIVWYTPDQDFGLKHGVMAEFFGVPAATVTMPREFAQVENTAVMAIHFYREPRKKLSQKPRYHIVISPALQHYPSDDAIADANLVNQQLETLINIDISQYMWFHRRFKHQPDGKNYYS